VYGVSRAGAQIICPKSGRGLGSRDASLAKVIFAGCTGGPEEGNRRNSVRDK